MGRWFALLAVVWITGMLLTTIVNGEVVENSDMENLDSMSTYKIVQKNSDGQIDVPASGSNLWGAVTQCLFWEFPFLEGGWEYIRLYFLVPVTLLIVAMIIVTFSSAVFGLFS